jgi:hypothetical protein
MSPSLRLWVLVVSLLITIVVVQILRRGRVPVKYSLLWFLSSAIILFVAVFPGVLDILANLMGFKTISNMVIGIMLVILLFITISLTVIVSGQKEKIRLLIQEVSMLKKKVDSYEDEK